VKLAAVAIGWLILLVTLARGGALLLPRSLAAALTLESYLSIVLVLSTCAGLAASFAVLPQPRAGLAIEERPRTTNLVVALLCAPVVLVVSAYLGFKLALPTLLEELAQGGRQAVERSTGEFGRTLVQAHVVTTLVWAIVLTPVAEELLFRGALWSAIRAPLGGWLATLITTVVFTLLHADQPGGAGIVRAVQAAVLGLALGCARHATGGIAAPMVLHAAFNLLTIAKLRRWIVSPGWPPPLPIATLYWQLAAVSAAVLLVAMSLIKQFVFRAEVTMHARAAPRLEGLDENLLPGAKSEVTVEPEGDGSQVRWTITREVRSLPLFAMALWRREKLRHAMRAALSRLHE